MKFDGYFRRHAVVRLCEIDTRTKVADDGIIVQGGIEYKICCGVVQMVRYLARSANVPQSRTPS